MKRLVIAGALAALALVACTPQQEINVTVNRTATITNVVTDAYGNGNVSVRFGGTLWCNRPVNVDFFLSVTQDGKDVAASDESIGCNSDEPAAWSRIFDFTYSGSQVPHVGRGSVTLQASTNESGRENNDFVNIQRLVDIS